mmetsp:Transcript_13717/g.58624  ORF Transcript_13717/g.58624 Transcript_13717/m.58624 type:complete len:291 (-) Transcript_13717:892-1764(-)
MVGSTPTMVFSIRSTSSPTAVTTSSPYRRSAASMLAQALGSEYASEYSPVASLSFPEEFTFTRSISFAASRNMACSCLRFAPSPDCRYRSTTFAPENSISATNLYDPGPSSSLFARYTSVTTGSLRIASVTRRIFSSPSERPSSNRRFEFIKYVAVSPNKPPTAMDPKASYAASPVTCAANSAAAATPQPATAAASSATTATEVGSWPACINSARLMFRASAFSRSATYATRKLYASIAADAASTPMPTNACSTGVGFSNVCTPCATETPEPAKNTPTALIRDQTNRSRR